MVASGAAKALGIGPIKNPTLAAVTTIEQQSDLLTRTPY